MDIQFKDIKKQLNYGDLKLGDVFYIMKPLPKDALIPNVYMKIGSNHDNTGAVNLVTGIAYDILDSEPVVKLNAVLTLSDID